MMRPPSGLPGMAQELPLAAPPVAALAGLVSYSRVRAGVHHTTDVLGGAAIGVAATLVEPVLRRWPPTNRPRPRPVLTRAEVDPSPEGGGVIVVVNASAGSARTR